MEEQREYKVGIVGGGLAGSECALTLANLGIRVVLFEMRPEKPTDVHQSDKLGELVCSNSLKSRKPDSAAGMLKAELDALGSHIYKMALANQVPAGGALAVDREGFANDITQAVEDEPLIEVRRTEVRDLASLADEGFDAIVLATGPLTSDDLAADIQRTLGLEELAFFDAAAPIVMADSLDMTKVFSQSRYEDDGDDYLNAPFTREEYEAFITELIDAKRVISKDFETGDLFQACQPIEEIARKGVDAPRYGSMKPVGLTDPRTGKRPWAVVQLRREDAAGQSYNLVGFQTNLTFGEQKRVFSMIPGLEDAEFARFGVMHRNTFIDAPKVMDATGALKGERADVLGIPVFIAGQLSGTEGYCEAIRSGLHVALNVAAYLCGIPLEQPPTTTVFGALLDYATSEATVDYQPMHVNFGIIEPLAGHERNKRARYRKYSDRAREALDAYGQMLRDAGLLANGEVPRAESGDGE